MKPLILIGGGGHCMSVIEAAESAGRTISGILDRPDLVGSEVSGYRIIGTDDDIQRYAAECEFIVTVGSIKSAEKRRILFNRLLNAGAVPAIVIASTAYVSGRAHIGPGTVVLHHATVNAGATIGENCIINTAANVEHNVTVGAHTHISTGAMVNGDARIGSCSFIGSGAVIANGISIASGSVIGAAAAVITDITVPGTYVGIPARHLSE